MSAAFESKARVGIGRTCENAVTAWWATVGVDHVRIDLPEPAFDLIRRSDWKCPDGLAKLPEFVAWSATRRPVLVDVKATTAVEQRVLKRVHTYMAALDMFVYFMVPKPLAEPTKWLIVRGDLVKDIAERGDARMVKLPSGDTGYEIPPWIGGPALEFWA